MSAWLCRCQCQYLCAEFITFIILNYFVFPNFYYKYIFGKQTGYIFQSPKNVRVTRSLVLYLWFVDRCLSFCTFFFWSLCCLFFFDIQLYGFWLPLWYPQTLLLNQHNIVCSLYSQICITNIYSENRRDIYFSLPKTFKTWTTKIESLN
jgi:hypothetical protein